MQRPDTREPRREIDNQAGTELRSWLEEWRADCARHKLFSGTRRRHARPEVNFCFLSAFGGRVGSIIAARAVAAEVTRRKRVCRTGWCFSRQNPRAYLGGYNSCTRPASGVRRAVRLLAKEGRIRAASDQIASDCDVKWNCFTFRTGVNEAPRPCVSEPLTRSEAPIISTFPGASSSRMLWLKRKLRTGY